VGSCTASETVSDFSGRGPTKEGLIKPEGVVFGENVIAADHKDPAGLVKCSGTSFACPIGSGIATLGRQIFRQWMTREWVERGLRYASTKPPGAPSPAGVKDNVYGYGTPDFRIYGAVTPRVPAAPLAPVIDLPQILNIMLVMMMVRFVL